ncbi:hypothetical protein C6A85_98420, partial [Mycobacterium sp. ITM-2017-0098]
MTGSDDSNSSTRPISVAELLAKNGTIGAPPVGGRRRRRRGNADAVTVAELTGEIPIIRPDDPPPLRATAVPVQEPVVEPEPEPEPTAEVAEAEVPDAEDVVKDAVPEDEDAVPEDEVAVPEDAIEETELDEAAVDEDTAEPDEIESAAADDSEPADENDDDDYADAVAEYAARLEQRGTDPEPAEPQPTRRFGLGRLGRKGPAVDAESWTPDPVDEGGVATDEVEDVVE